MLLNKFFINVLIRVTFIVLSSVVFGIALQHLDRGYYYTLTSIQFSEKAKTNSFGNLHNRMNQLNKIIQSVKIENERTGQFRLPPSLA